MRILVLLLVGSAWLHALVGVGGDDLFGRWVYLAVVAGAGVLCLRAAPRAPWVWGAFGAGLLAKAAGDVIYALADDLDAVPVPSMSDPLWLAIYPCVYVGLVALTRARVGRVLWAPRLDGLICGLAVAAVLACVTVPGAVGGAQGAPLLEQVTTLAYPLGDLVLLGAIVMALAVGGWRIDALVGTLAVAVIAWEAADLMYLYGADGTPGRIADALALTGVAGLGVAATLPLRHAGAAPDRGILLPVGFAAVALVVVALARPLELSGVGLGAAVLALALVLVRTALILRQHRALLAESRAEAITDPLTGLGNRRRLRLHVDAAFADARPHALVMLDLNGFKAFNDRFGHHAGDELLAAVSARLLRALRDDASAYRLGGDEFCVLAPCEPAAVPAIARRCAAALTYTRGGHVVTAAYGAVAFPGGQPSPTAALAAADALMYEDKRGGAARAA